MGVSAAEVADLVGDVAPAGERGPVYATLAERLRLLVADGRLPLGARLPAERDLATATQVSRATVTAAYGRLRAQGWAAARQGSGTWTTLPSGAAAAPFIPAVAEPGVVDLSHAAPAAPPGVAAAYAAALQELPRLLPSHGYHPVGLPDLRARIAARCTLRGLPTTPEQILVTGGALHGISVALETVVRRRDRVLVEHPSYPNGLDAIVAAGARPVPVGVLAADPATLVRGLGAAADAVAPRAAYLMPDFQNPTGLLLNHDDRQRLAADLAGRDVLAIVDETLAELWLDAEPAVPYAAAVPDRAVVTVGTLSKLFWAGLRVGWLRSDAATVEHMAEVAARRRVAEPVLEQLAACHLLDRVDELLPPVRAQLRSQRDSLVAAVSLRLPDVSVQVPAGGLVLWCELATPCSTALVAAAAERGLRLAAGPRFGVGHAFEDRLRLPYTHPTAVLESAVDVLAEVIASLRA